MTSIIKKALCLLVFVSISNKQLHASDTVQQPATYHLSFNNMDFLADDFSARYKEPSPDLRNLKIVSGKFGKALLNANTFNREDFEKTAMSTWDLDTLLEVLCHHRFEFWKELRAGRMEPFIWGTGRLNGESGTVAFWARGKRSYPGRLFFQSSSSFGRFEKYLIAIELREDRSLEAYVRDARYDFHRIISAPVWDEDDFNHVALSWDRSMGLVLYLNGVEIASNWGDDSWWTTQIAGLFHMPMCGFTYDELWLFDRPLTNKEVNRLMRENHPPHDTSLPKPPDSDAVERLRKTFVGDNTSMFPVIKPFDGSNSVVFREIFPEWAGDGCSQAPFVLDGKYELAWPQDYTSFTNILGDSDFHPEKVDFRLPEGSTVNYVTIEGNLTDASLYEGSNSDDTELRKVFDVPEDGRFFHGAGIPETSSTFFRIPFLKGYGSPPGYEEGLNLALTGDIRIHEVGFYHVGKEPVLNEGGTVRKLSIHPGGDAPDDSRYGYAFRALNDRRNSRVLSLTDESAGKGQWVTPGPFTRLNLFAPPVERGEAVRSIELNLRLRGVKTGDIAIMRVHDPGVPSRIWNSIVFRMEEFTSNDDILRLNIDCADLKFAEGDRLWIDCAFSGGEKVRTGGNSGSFVLLETAPLVDTDGRYAEKALKPARSDFTKIYYWYYPWTEAGIVPDINAPVTFGGFFDIVTYPLSVVRTEPDNFEANTLLELALIKNPVNNSHGFTVDISIPLSWNTPPELWPPVRAAPADNSPEWAFYMNYYLTRYRDIVYWWADHQNPDGQVGGGWNDDVLFASRLPGVFLYSGDEKARNIFNRIFRGLEHTRMFYDGYCNIVPMDYVHVDDLVRNRYEGLIFEPGDPHKMNIAMRTAWHFDKPDETPVNYIDGNSFKYDRELINWYWGETPDYPTYSTTREQVTATMKKFAPSMNDVFRFRYTEAGMFTDGAYMPGCYDIKRIQVGGGWGPYTNAISLAVSWEKGGGPEIPKWVESATDTSFVAHFYSYDSVEREVAARLYRLKKGIYRITLSYEGNHASFGTLIDRTEELTRFSEVSFPVRPKRELVLSIVRVKSLPEAEALPDLAVSSIDRSGAGLSVVVSNFGSADAPDVTVRLMGDGGAVLSEKTVGGIQSAKTYVPGEARINFPVTSGSSVSYRVIVDPENSIEEIYEGNNECLSVVK